MRFRSRVEQHGRTATGVPVPPEVVEALGGGGRPAVVVTLGGHTYRTTVGTMGGQELLPLSAEHRAAAGLAAGDEVEVDLELDTAERVVEVPADLAAALEGEPAAGATFAAATASQRAATRDRRLSDV
ncbi:DUF1905 domain-containing protein [Pseudokineococcus marinus]|uniref:DUF1905 domain-containing protein n=1 Tax=Pseudokineococcus marinus TaxID=351215 RepID=A0A849BH06_9ACTN|nr:DUF1905 domain-containing protein [Pseudokineococcus marinus]NNH22400.1 DUF1905 domain-containing protein [Pseudokineococcus marinus]